MVTESRGLVTVFVRGDHRIQEIKLTNALGEEFRPARDEELAEHGLVGGYMGPRRGCRRSTTPPSRPAATWWAPTAPSTTR